MRFRLKPLLNCNRSLIDFSRLQTGANLLKRPTRRIMSTPIIEPPFKNKNTIPIDILDNPITSSSNKRLSRLMLETLAEKEGVSPVEYLLGKGKTAQANEINKAFDNASVKNMLKNSLGNEKLPLNYASERKADILKNNKIKGDAYEKQILEETNQTHSNLRQQVTLKTENGVKTRIDIIGTNKETGKIELIEAKSSSTAPLTENQKVAFPEIMKKGATIVGKGKYPYVGGIQIPPTMVKINRPTDD